MANNIQQRPPTQTRAPEVLDPSGPGRGDGYATNYRELTIALEQAGESNNPIFQQLRQLGKYPSKSSAGRWKRQQEALGHVRPCRRTGNNRATVLRDHNLLLLALYRIAYPKANAAELNAFLYDANYGDIDFRFYSSSQVSESETRIKLTRKRGSCTAYQALLPINIAKRWMYWNLPYPYGIADIRRQDLIDIDECGKELSHCDRHIGKSYQGERVKQTGPYTKSDKYNLLLAISGDGATNRRWRDIWTGEGTTGERMIAFIRRIVNAIGPGTPARRYCFTMDNLRYVLYCTIPSPFSLLFMHMAYTNSLFSSIYISDLIIIDKCLQLSMQQGTGSSSVPHTTQWMVLLNMYSILFKGYCRFGWIVLQMAIVSYKR